MTPGHAITDISQKVNSATFCVSDGGTGNEPMKPLRSEDLSYTLSRAVFRCEKDVVGLSSRNYKSELE
ncbi:hypothetical protein CEXT_213571 [Caerostris extrusa]|uniref:Uncharacterized protein n=1 Tax=Caerostris extrusa TaxID=172846 RepID=A0AAV4MG05_CAEEX|nr:hypothetical protein CEXT_213571 [Caerostris extrusa]